MPLLPQLLLCLADTPLGRVLGAQMYSREQMRTAPFKIEGQQMKPLIAAVYGCVLGVAVTGYAQSLEDLNIQVHGYATQGFLYTNNNNIFTTNSSDGSPAWTDAVINIGAQPTPKLRIAFQARYFLLGNYGNAITLDWAAADYKASDRLGARFGKVKTPVGLFNEIQDIDPAYLWALLPESVYPIDNRASYLTHYGGVVYGTIALSRAFGKFEYRAFGGEGLYTDKDGYFIAQAESGINLPNGVKGPLYGGALHWRTPLSGLMVGASALKDNSWRAAYTGNSGATTGTETLFANTQPNFFAIYEKNKIMVATEYTRSWGNQLVQFPATPDAYSLQRRSRLVCHGKLQSYPEVHSGRVPQRECRSPGTHIIQPPLQRVGCLRTLRLQFVPVCQGRRTFHQWYRPSLRQ
jgi:hypothetical protein